MHKFPVSAVIAATLLAGCAPAQKSHTWQIVKAVRHAGPAEKEPAAAYAATLHKTLQNAGIAHKVVTLKFRYDFRILLRREAEETAVIYRDPATPKHPWWLMAERLSRPVWLPCEPVASQAAFYLSRPVNIVKVEDFPAGETKHAAKGKHDGKTMRKPLKHGKKSGRASHKPR
jgi:hypothetical protein